MPSLTERFSDLVTRTFRPRQATIRELRDYQDQLVDRLGVLRMAMHEAHDFDPAAMAEYDSHWVDSMMRHTGDVMLSPLGSREPNESMRQRAVTDSRVLTRFDPIGKQIIRLWTSYGFGKHVDIQVQLDSEKPEAPMSPVAPYAATTPPADGQGDASQSGRSGQAGPGLDDEASTEALMTEATPDETAQTWFDEFWRAKRNWPILKPRHLTAATSDKLLVDGELVYMFFIGQRGGDAGRVTVRSFPTDELADMVSAPDDVDDVRWYHRVWSQAGERGQPQEREAYYPVWTLAKTPINQRDTTGLPDNAERADEMDDSTDVVALHIAFEADDNGRGWPLIASAIDWINETRRYAEDMTTLTSSNAMFARQIKHRGGSRATDRIKSKLGSTLSSAGLSGDWVDSNPPAVSGSTYIGNEAAGGLQDTPINRTVSESTNVKQLLLMMAALGGGVFPHYIGSGESFRLATASAMEAPLIQQWEKYRLFWEDVLTDMINLVLDAAEMYAGQEYPEDERDIDVDLDVLQGVDLDKFAAAFVQLSDYIPDDRTKSSLAMQALNVPDTQQLLDKAFPANVQSEMTQPEASAEDFAGLALMLNEMLESEDARTRESAQAAWVLLDDLRTSVFGGSRDLS